MRVSSDRLAFAALSVVILFAIGQLAFNAFTLDTWMDEGKYLMKGFWYVTGRVRPYSEVDPTYYMPIIFYADGLMEWIFGIGYLPGRVLSILFAIGCLILVYLTGRHMGRSRVAGVAAVVLVAGHSVTLTYFATATPYALVSFLSLLLIYVLLTMQSRVWAYALSGLILWALFFTRPDMLPFAIVPTGWAFLIEERHRIFRLFIAFAVFVVASAVTMAAFGTGLLQVVLDTPGLSQITILLGAPPAPITNILPFTIAPMDPVYTIGELPGYFYRFFFSPYFAVAVSSLLMIGIRVVRAVSDPSERHVKPIDLILSYFWITTILHFLLSLSYCVDCIIPYTNYFLPVGALAAAALVGEISQRATGERPALVMLGSALAIGVAILAFPAFPTLLRPATGNLRMLARDLSAQLRTRIPLDKRILVVSGSVATSQAVWLAGGVVEPRSLYLPTTFREPRPELPQAQRANINQVIWDAGFWSEASMRAALPRDYAALLVERRSAYDAPLAQTVRDGIPFGDLVSDHFQLIATATVNDRSFELYERRVEGVKGK
jgi:hypothetical protein